MGDCRRVCEIDSRANFGPQNVALGNANSGIKKHADADNLRRHGGADVVRPRNRLCRHVGADVYLS